MLKYLGLSIPMLKISQVIDFWYIFDSILKYFMPNDKFKAKIFAVKQDLSLPSGNSISFLFSLKWVVNEACFDC